MGKRNRNKNNSDNSEFRGKKPKKDWKGHQRIHSPNSNGGVDDSELLYIQGLVRCESCESTYPRDLAKCPHRICNQNT